MRVHSPKIGVNRQALLGERAGVRVIRETIPLMRAAKTEQLPRMYEVMLIHIAEGRLPPREDRINPRVVKVKMSHYRKKRPPDKGVCVKPFRDAVVVLK
jgi:hypothetical protein